MAFNEVGAAVCYDNTDAYAISERKRKFGFSEHERCYKAICKDCGLGWDHHTDFYCLERYKSKWKQQSAMYSVADSDGKIKFKNSPVDWTGTTVVNVSCEGAEKEEKVFALLYFNFANGNVETQTFKTQEEAQLALETKAASLQTNLTTKNFYTLSLLNAKTGQFLGFTSQAPPSITLNGATR